MLLCVYVCALLLSLVKAKGLILFTVSDSLPFTRTRFFVSAAGGAKAV